MPFSPGARLGPYEILEPLGAGGMGEMWRARDARPLHTFDELKRLVPGGRQVVERWQQIEALFHEALQHDPEERDAWLREACHGDAGLQAEVASLLANHHAATDFEPWAAAAAAQLIDGSASLQAGQRLGPYEILAPIGKGGMGEVYKAHDTRLKRDVAIKICAAQFSERFEREARVIASLNHPNICQLHDIGPNYLVMELVEGENLSGPLPVETALNYARQIAEALEAAHEKGIVHRDLKPANVKVTPAGVVKVLDFGLAKAAEEPSTAADRSKSPTVTVSPTRVGMILGTAPYMAPEQARGTPVDKRTDIWAFGCVLYEMLTGKRAFHGKTTSDILAAVLKEEPDWSRIPATVQPLLRRCLVKDPKHRLRDIGDAMPLLEGVPQLALAPRPWPWVVAAMLAIALLALGFLYFREPPAAPPVLKFFIAPPEKTIFATPAVVGPPALSPDGRRLAFVALQEDGSRQIWIQPLDALAAHPLSGVDNAIYPFWSPDSKWLGFFADGKLKKIDVSGGPALALCDSGTNSRGGTWNQEGVIVFSPGVNTPLYRVHASGGAASPVTSLDTSRHEGSHRLPWFLPDGRHFLYTSRIGTRGNGWIRIASLDSASDTRTLMASPLPSNAMYANGYMLFTNEGTLMAQPFDAKRLATTGEAVPVAEQVQYESITSAAMFSTAAKGVLVYETRGGENRKLIWFDRTGKQVSSIGTLPNLFQFQFGFTTTFRLSPDGKSVALVLNQGQNYNLWILDLQRGVRTRFTFDPASFSPVWSPDGRSIVFASNRKGHMDLYRKPADQTGNEELLYADNFDKIPASWSPDGKFLLYSSVEAMGTAGNNGIWVLPMAGEHKPFRFAQTAYAGRFSPNGRWVTYQSSDSGQSEIYVAPFPGPGAKRQVSNNGGGNALWRPDGREIVYIGPGGQLMAAEMRENGAAMEIGAVQAVFRPISLQGFFAYDISPDGKQILTSAAVETNASERLAVVQNWMAGLKK